MDPETAKFVLEQKSEFLSAALSACMLWWVSSIVFCGSVLGALWLKREELSKPRFRTKVRAIITTFLLSVAAFGLASVYHIWRMEYEIHELAQVLRAKHLLRTELIAFKTAMWIGTISFVFATYVFLTMWRELFTEAPEAGAGHAPAQGGPETAPPAPRPEAGEASPAAPPKRRGRNARASPRRASR